ATGSLYGINEKSASSKLVAFGEQLVRPDEWFTMEVITQGNHVVIKVNGRTTADFNDGEKRFNDRGYLALQQHDPQTIVRFRKIEIKEFVDDTEPKEGKRKSKSAGGKKMSPKSPKSKKSSSKVGAKAGRLEGKKPGDERDDNSLGMRLVWCPAGEP